MDQPTAEQVLARLEPLIGEWSLEATWPNGDPWPGTAGTTFEWHPSRSHVIQRSWADLPEAPTAVAVIGCDGAKGTFQQLYSDDRGVCRIYDMSIGDGEWRLWREGEPFSQRFVGVFSDDGATITAHWDIAEDLTTYTKDFDLVYRRIG
jgi:hypothetical protein